MKTLFAYFCASVLMSQLMVHGQSIQAYLNYPVDSAVTIGLSEYFSFASESISVSPPLHGTATLLPNGAVRYVANSMAHVPYIDQFAIHLQQSDNYIHSIYIGIIPTCSTSWGNIAPLLDDIALDYCADNLSHEPSQTTLFAQDGNSDDLDFFLTTPAQHGTASITNMPAGNNALLHYLPQSDFVGTETLTYRICETNTLVPLCDEAEITIAVKDCMAEPIVAYPDYVDVNSTQSIDINVLANDYADTIPIIEIIDQGNWGIATLNADNTVNYASTVNISNTSDIFRYRLCNAQGYCSDTVEVSVFISPNEIVPFVSGEEHIFIAQNDSETIHFFANDYYETYLPDTSIILQNPLHGTLTWQSADTWSYQPFENEFQNASYYNTISEYILHLDCLSNGFCAISQTTITIYFYKANDDILYLPHQSNELDVLNNDMNGEYANISAIYQQPQHATVSVSSDHKHITYTPNDFFWGSDELSYIACDNNGNCDTAKVNIYIYPYESTVGNLSPPVMYTDDYLCEEELSELHLHWQEAAQADETYNISIVQEPHYGTLQIQDGKWYYTPLPEMTYLESYTDTLYYRVCETNTDELYCADSRIVLHIVDCHEQYPLASVMSFVVGQCITVNWDISQNATTEAWDVLTYTLLDSSSYGTATLSPEGVFSYSLNADQSDMSIDSMRYVACDLLGVCDTSYFLISINSDICAVLGNADQIYDYSGGTGICDVLQNDIENCYIAGLLNVPDGLHLTLSEDLITYTSDSTFYGDASFSYIVCHPTGLCDTVQVNYQIDPINVSTVHYAPLSSNVVNTFCEEDDFMLPLLKYDANPTDSLVLTIMQPPVHGSLEILTGDQILFHTQNDYVGFDTIRYRVCEANTIEQQCSESSLVMQFVDCLTGYSANEDFTFLMTDSTMTITVSVLANDYIEESESIVSLDILSMPEAGELVVNADFSVTYHFNGNSIDLSVDGEEVFYYVACTNSGICDTSRLRIILQMPPTSVENDIFFVALNTPTILDVLNNDAAGSQIKEIENFSPSATIVLNPDQTLTYTMPVDTAATGSVFAYKVCEPYHACVYGHVDVTFVRPENNHLPATVAHDDYYYMPSYYIGCGGVGLPVLENDNYTPYLTQDIQLLSIVEQAIHGTVVPQNYSYWDSPNYLYYTPFETSEIDSFRYAICSYVGDLLSDSPSIQCDTASVYLAPFCLYNCVYPGDVNNDQLVNTLDFLSLGIAGGGSGSPRPSPIDAWIGQDGTFWEDYYCYNALGESSMVINKRYADCDGNGFIDNPTEVHFIDKYYGKYHLQQGQTLPSTEGLFPLPTAPQLRLDLPDTIVPNSRNYADIYLGTVEHPFTDLYGFSFELSFPPEQIPVDSITINLTDTWLGEQNELLPLLHREDGMLSVGFTRQDQQGKAGFGKIARLSYYVTNDTTATPPNQSLDVHLSNTYYSDSLGNIALLQQLTTSSLSQVAIGIAPPPIAPVSNNLRLFPNPATDILHLQLIDQQAISQITLTDLMGRKVYEQHFDEQHGSKASLSLAALSGGVYVVQVRTRSGVFVQRVVVK